jgi:P27 family predicted phage terminase small subunit
MKQRGRKSAASLQVFPKPHLVPPAPAPEMPEAPSHLGQPEQKIWRDVLREFKGTDASLALLISGLESHMRARECREAIAREGMTVDGTAGQLKAHPLLSVERAALRGFQQTFKALGLKV